MSFSNSSIDANKQIFIDKLKKFIIDNSVIGTTAGVCIALVTKDLIASLVGDIIIPGIIILFIHLNIQSLTKMLPGKSSFDFTNFFKQFISWVLVIIITFIFITYAFKGLLGISDGATTTATAAPTTPEKQKESFFSY
jgi:large-conductance mechanosensitive channel